jgi:hypothetical protein
MLDSFYHTAIRSFALRFFFFAVRMLRPRNDPFSAKNSEQRLRAADVRRAGL